MHKITIHESAAYVIGRRGLGFNEKLSFYKIPHECVKDLTLGTLGGKYIGKKIHSWRLWKALNDNTETVLTGPHVRLSDLKEFVGNTWCRSETLQGRIFLLEQIAGSDNNTVVLDG